MILDVLKIFRGHRRQLFSVGEDTRVYAVGDIHGRADLLGAIIEEIQNDSKASSLRRKVLVYIGDYVDRGLQSREVIDYLLSSPTREFEVVYLKGNHEAWLLEFLEGKHNGVEWFWNGGRATLLSYGVELNADRILEGRLDTARIQLSRNLPEAHLTFLKSLKLTHTEGDYLFVHAGVRPGKPLEAQVEADLLWIRDEFTRNESGLGKCVVHGHTVSEAPEIRPNRIGIDTGAYATDRLTCLVLEGESRRFLCSS